MTEILVGYDGSAEARAAVDWALNEAERTGAEVRLGYAFEWVTAGSWLGPGIGTVATPWPDEIARREVEKLVRDAVAEAGRDRPGIRVHGEVLDGPAAVRLQERSARATLLVLGSRGHGGFTGLLAGSTTASLGAHAHCPVVVVRSPEPDTGPVVVGVDGSEHSLLALSFAADRAAARAEPLRVLRAWAEPAAARHLTSGGGGLGGPDPEEAVQTERAALDELLAGVRQTRPRVEIAADVVIGNPAEALVEASRGARLVVVGSRGRGGFRGLLLGSVSQQVMHHAGCPVAVVRELPAGISQPG